MLFLLLAACGDSFPGAFFLKGDCSTADWDDSMLSDDATSVGFSVSTGAAITLGESLSPGTLKLFCDSGDRGVLAEWSDEMNCSDPVLSDTGDDENHLSYQCDPLFVSAEAACGTAIKTGTTLIFDLTVQFVNPS